MTLLFHIFSSRTDHQSELLQSQGFTQQAEQNGREIFLFQIGQSQHNGERHDVLYGGGKFTHKSKT